MIRVNEAIEIIKDNTRPVDGWEEVFLDGALDRVSYEDVFSQIDVPSFSRSAMDGYAVVFSSKNDKRFRIVDDEGLLKEGCCIRINTGFPIPEQADAIAEVEIVKKDGGFIELTRDIERQRNFTFSGVELKRGDVVVARGERISVRKWGLLAYSGVYRLKVRRRPNVGIITTGDEVVFAGDRLKRGGVYNANYYILYGLTRKWLCNPIYFGHVKDDPEKLREAIAYAINRCDAVLTTGGVSKGSRDFIKSILKDMDAKVFFDKTTIKPGKPAVFATVGDKPFFGLPGWPAALYTTAYVYLKPMLFRLAGLDSVGVGYPYCVMDEPTHSRAGKCYFNRVRLSVVDGEYHGVSAGSQKTDNFYSIAVADGLVRIDEEEEDKEEGVRLPLIVFDD
ncbi:molybdopterin molybdotransferase MoeA [Hippea sp. KM1]|uniref:molybdopterin molybdotransferase MoeA n=1 Tax=Hippea sp. KM1 TaxID=944481 RepID=UPI00046D62F6|nr:molybdopterin molybdotransferase MoeA [Hippea sp. KM1]